MSLRSSISTPQGKRRHVRRLFATIADRYDLITVLLSYGQDRRWKRRLAAMAGVSPGERALDLACGTGDIAFELTACGARVVGLDLTPRMIALAREKRGSRTNGASAAFLVGDMMALPFADASFDVVTTGYGIRNVPDVARAIDEIRRVLKDGGCLLSLDFNRPEHPFVRWLYLTYLTFVGSILGLALHRDPDTYRYIPESIRIYPGARGIARLLAEHRFVDVEYVPVLGGLMTIHCASKPSDRRSRGAIPQLL